MTGELPSNVQAERALIGACISRAKIDGVAGRVAPADFSNVVNRTIWDALTKMSANDQPLDVISVVASLKGTDITHAEASVEITAMIGEVPSTMHVDKYAELVLTTSAKRKLALSLPKLSRIAFGDGAYDPYAVFAEAMAEIENASQGIQPAEREQWTAAELAALEISEDPWLLDGLLIEGGLNLIAGEIASGKTFLCLDLSIAMATEGKAWGRNVKPGSVVYFGADNSRDDLTRRVRDLCTGRAIRPPQENLIFDLSAMDLGTPAGIATVRQLTSKHNASLVIIDALARYMGSMDENSAADVGDMMASFREISRKTGTAFIIIHHLRKMGTQFSRAGIADRVRGSGDFIAAVDSAIVITTGGEGPGKTRNLTHIKSRASEESAPLSFIIMPDESGGLTLPFSKGDAKISSNTLAEVASDMMAEALSRDPGVEYTKGDLRRVLDEAEVDLSTRTEAAAFKILKNLPKIMARKQGRANVYMWNK